MKTVTLYTDGACSGNPGPGGWGAILCYGEHELSLSGGEAHTTNNRMELTAVIEGLKKLKEPCIVELYSDSKYVIDALSKGWAWGWKKKGWVKSDKKPALNPDLWDVLLALVQTQEVHYHWVQGPCGQYIQQPLRRHGRGRVAEAEMIFAALSGNGAGGGAPEGEGP